jgi:hypothetical protein
MGKLFSYFWHTTRNTLCKKKLPPIEARLPPIEANLKKAVLRSAIKSLSTIFKTL